jgi:hypothetical protein
MVLGFSGSLKGRPTGRVVFEQGGLRGCPSWEDGAGVFGQPERPPHWKQQAERLPLWQGGRAPAPEGEEVLENGLALAN